MGGMAMLLRVSVRRYSLEGVWGSIELFTVTQKSAICGVNGHVTVMPP